MGYFSNFELTAQSKQSPKRHKFTQSGHPGALTQLRCKVPFDRGMHECTAKKKIFDLVKNCSRKIHSPFENQQPQLFCFCDVQKSVRVRATQC
jgi:hypothetical protein